MAELMRDSPMEEKAPLINGVGDLLCCDWGGCILHNSLENIKDILITHSMNENFDVQKFINYNRGHTAFARKLRSNQTPAEKLLWERLRNNQLGVRFLRQKPL